MICYFFGGIYFNYSQKESFKNIIFNEEKTYLLKIEKPAWESENGYSVATLADTNHQVTIKIKHLFNSGDIIEVKGKIVKNENSNGVNWQNYWLAKGVVGRLILSSEPEFKSFSPTILNGIENFRYNLILKISTLFTSPQDNLANGLLLGYRAQFDDKFEENMQNTGTTHIVAISGYNVAIVIAIFFSSLLFLGLNRAFCVSIVFLIGFIFLVGAEPSVVRAGILALIALGAKVLGRPVKYYYLLCLVALIMILLNPFILKYSASFQLSILAVTGLFYLEPIIINTRFFKLLPNSLKEPIATTISAQVAVLPILLSYFGGFSIISIISNSLILPFIPLGMMLIFLSLILSFLSNFIGLLLAKGAQVILDWIIFCINFLGQKFALINVSWSDWMSLVFYLVLILLIVKNNKKDEKNI